MGKDRGRREGEGIGYVKWCQKEQCIHVPQILPSLVSGRASFQESLESEGHTLDIIIHICIYSTQCWVAVGSGKCMYRDCEHTPGSCLSWLCCLG